MLHKTLALSALVPAVKKWVVRAPQGKEAPSGAEPSDATDLRAYFAETSVWVDRAVDRLLPRALGERADLFRWLEPARPVDAAALQRAVVDPLREFLGRGGKRWRPSLYRMVCETYGGRPADVPDLAAIPELIHNGTLIIDDIEDGSPLRRGQPALHRITGTDVALNAGNALYYLPLLPLFDAKDRLDPALLLSLHEAVLRTMASLSLGQAMDIAWHQKDAHGASGQSLGLITEDQYLQMCAWKTGALARLAAELGALTARAPQDAVRRTAVFAETIGVAFQIQDDLLDLEAGEFSDRKGGRGQDITEGKVTLPVIRALATAGRADRERLLQILVMHTEGVGERAEAIAILHKTGAVDSSRRTARDLVRKSWADLQPLLGATPAAERFRAFAEGMVERAL